MSFCINGCIGACQDDNIETLNSLIRVQSLYPARSHAEALVEKTVSCVCIPLKLLTALGMCIGGIRLCLTVCNVCYLVTKHEGGRTTIEYMYGKWESPILPCYYKDSYAREDQVSVVNGCGPSPFQLGHPTGKMDKTYVFSSITGYDCMAGATKKVVQTLVNAVCCPLACCLIGLSCAVDGLLPSSQSNSGPTPQEMI